MNTTQSYQPGDEVRQRILDFVRAHWQLKKCSPTTREIMTACHISSTSVVDYHLRVLERNGQIDPLVPYQSRRVVPAGLTVSI